MANRLMSAYGNLAQARTDIGRNLSDIAGIGIEMEYGKEGRIAGEMAQRDIATQTAAIGLGLEAVQKIAGLGKAASEEAVRAEEMGTLAGTGAEQTVGETRLWDLLKGKAELGEGETWWGEFGERVGTGLGLMDREYNIGDGIYTSSQLEAGSPWAKLGKDWEEVSKLMGGGRSISTPSITNQPNQTGPGKTFRYRPSDNETNNTTSRYADMTFSEYLDDPMKDQSLVNQLMSQGWASATQQWKEARKTL
jgi:hypothetical protein